MLPVVVAITGASGAPYAVRLLDVLARHHVPVWLIVSSHGWRLLKEETGIADEAQLRAATGGDWSSVTFYPDGDRGALPASGSAKSLGMVICPCSMGTVAAIAGGTSRSLVERAADVVLKERRRLILVPRETPLSLVHLRNLTAVTEAGAIVLPAAPGFYHRPTRVSELVDFIVQRVVDHLGLEIEDRAALAGVGAEHQLRPLCAMRLGIIADTHGLLRPEVFEVFAEVDHILHAGDIGSLNLLTELEAIAPVTAVYGNCDDFEIRAKVPAVVKRRFEGLDFVLTHGDHLGSPTPQGLYAAYPEAEVIIYGHTHRPLLTTLDMVVTVMNPGGAGRRRFNLPPSVGIMELESGLPPRARLVPLTDL